MKVSRFEKDNFFFEQKNLSGHIKPRNFNPIWVLFFLLSFQVNSFMGNEPNFFELADKVVKKRRERVSRSNTFPDFELDIVKYRVSSFFQIT